MHVSSWECQGAGETAINCTGEAPAGRGETEGQLRHLVRCQWGRSDVRDNCKQEVTGRGAVGPGSMERERLSKEERGKTSGSWQTKLQKWVGGD